MWLLTDGVAHVFREHVRPRLPGAPVAYAGMPIAIEIKPGDRWLLERWSPGDVRDFSESEATLVAQLRQHVQPGDRVVVVGGGVGVTAVVSAQQTGVEGEVIVYEGSASGVRAVRQTARLNSVSDQITAEHAVVASPLHVYGRRQGRAVDPAALPVCDVLERDCEGSEIEILAALAIRPRVLDLVRQSGYDAEVVGVAEPPIPEICEKYDIRIVAGTQA